MSEPVLLIEDIGGVRRVTLNRPEKLNALNEALIAKLSATLSAAERDPAVRAVLLSGAGRAFCAGVDTGGFATLADEATIRAHAQRLAAVFQTLVSMTKPVIAAAHGYALGAGCGLVATCDMAIAAHDAVLGYPEAARGLMPALVTPTLLRAVGEKRAFDLLATGRRLSSRQAAELGLVSRVADTDAAKEALDIAQSLAKVEPELLARLKRLLRDCAGQTPEVAIQLAAEANVGYRLAAARQGEA
ncbi:enoyl-CoA hydratase/isomerase family protein [Ferruginivarius sediminum]|uniref:Enoyl-CoA hydratase/isomerase family protein n=1 Tax=Ferruginivarius sediminum TaxID=2661937 RepID=A0A369TCU5_9PROT|nr:enoyl-CoA hydratase/isomerase family protein [Ferruginivarius sediminum]RDD62354.1 enoyl-CoA hydratase/isomerase family protein [Ferruginivarius sediminum]